jgi:hypothetical protein
MGFLIDIDRILRVIKVCVDVPYYLTYTAYAYYMMIVNAIATTPKIGVQYGANIFSSSVKVSFASRQTTGKMLTFVRAASQAFDLAVAGRDSDLISCFIYCN